MRHVIFTLLMSVMAVQVAHAEVQVIVHPSNGASIDSAALSNIFLGKSSEFPDGSIAVPIDLSDDNDAKAGFYSAVTNKDLSQLNAYWSKLIFTGKGKPPKAMDDSDEVLELIAANPNMIGYIEGGADSSVKVIMTIP